MMPPPAPPPDPMWSAIETLNTTLGLVVTLAAIVGWFFALLTLWRIRHLTRTQVAFEKRQSTLLLDYDNAVKENARLAEERDRWLPDKWLQAADKEVASGNDAKAIDLLDQGYQRVRESLAMVAHRIAEYHASRMIGFDASLEHGAALRLSRVAAGLAPKHRAIVELAGDLEGIEIVDGEPLQLAASRFDAADSDEAVRVISAALAANRRLLAEGRYRPCILLCERAVKLARRHGMSEQEVGLVARYYLAQALLDGGHYQHAFDEVTELLPIDERVWGREHPEVLATRYLKADILSRLGDYQQALDAVTELLPIRERVQGREHPGVLATRYLKTQMLTHLGQYQDALGEVTDLLRLEERVRGREHPEVLLTRQLKANILSDLGEYQQALDAVTDLRPLQERVWGREHPETLKTHFLEAKILSHLGQFHQALEAVTELLPLDERVLGREHPGVLPTRFLKAQILSHLGEYQEALDAVTDLLPLQERLLGREHPDSLSTRRAISEMLFALGRIPEAEQELSTVLALQVEHLGADHLLTLISELIQLEILAAKGEHDAALAQIDRVHDTMLAASGPGDLRVQRTAALRDRLKKPPLAPEA